MGMSKFAWRFLAIIPLLFLTSDNHEALQITEEEALRATLREMSKDLRELQELTLLFQKEFEKMTPEEKRFFCEKHPELRCG